MTRRILEPRCKTAKPQITFKLVKLGKADPPLHLKVDQPLVAPQLLRCRHTLRGV